MPVPTLDAGGEPRASMRERAMTRIRDAIYDGTLQPGEPLLDHQLQAWLGCSRKPIREALNDLVSMGLVENAPQRYTRVARPDEASRTFVFQTLGALVGGVVRVTVPTLDEPTRADLVERIERIIEILPDRDPVAYGARAWLLVDEFVAVCPNRILVEATRDNIGALAHRLRMTSGTNWIRWDELDVDFPRFRGAIAEGDAIAAELAIERMFRMSEPVV
ncbi:GntR family transcriptional regulator [Plantibacter flavus]|uniref:GntR family transcriptional regulator n=1 Tax=Plantibacter flavus TaxID=150123 RepID=UPI003F185685